MYVRAFTFALAVAYLISTVYSVNNANSLRSAFSCSSDNDCSNQGKCDSSGTCSCYSGYGNSNNGFDCATAPSATCSSSYTNISSLGASFSPSLSINVAGSVLSIGVSVPLESTQFVASWDSTSSLKNASAVAYSLDTTISFGTTSACNYPPLPSSAAWTKPAAVATACKDRYQFSMSWRDAKTNCGFTYDSVTKSWVQQVTMTRRYSIPYDTSVVDEQRKRTTTRSETSTQVLRISFPDQVDVSADVSISGPSAVSATALSSVSFAPSEEVWEVDVMVLTAKPYKLVLPTASVTGIASGRLVSSRTTITNQGACDSNSASCTQKITVFISQCAALTGQLAISVNAVCSGGADNMVCADVPSRLTITANLDTDSSCDLLNNITIKTKALTAFATADFDTSVSTFVARDIVYFGATIISSDAVIQSKTIESVCFILNPSSSSSACVPFNYNIIPSPNPAIDPAFSIDLVQTRALTNETSAQVFGVRVTFALAWNAPSSMKRSDESQNSARVQTVALIQVTQINNATSADGHETAADQALNDNQRDDTKWKAITIASASVAGAVVIGVIIILSLVYRKRRQEREAERSFNFSQIN